MNELPNYFLADLPVDATLSPALLAEACMTLKRNREHYLAPRSTEDIVRLISRVADNWMDAEYPFRQRALAHGPEHTGFSRATIERGINEFFGPLTRESLHALLTQDLGDARRLDQFCALPGERRSALATGPEFLVHFAAGKVPNPIWTGLLLGLLTRSAQFVHCDRGTSYLPRLFAHSLYDADHKLGACLEIAEWGEGHAALETEVLGEADCVTAMGSDEALTAIRRRLKVCTRFVGYGQRVSFGFAAADVLYGRSGKKVIAGAADDVTAWDQLGCLSPHVFYVQRGGEIAPEEFARLLAEEMTQREARLPQGQVPTETAAAIAARRGIYQVRAAHSPETMLWQSAESTAWTVVYEAEARFAMSCQHRFVYVKAVNHLAEALQGADAVRGQVACVGLATGSEKANDLAYQLARWGVTRVCAFGEMQKPPFSWRREGRLALGELVTWTDMEGQ